MYEFIKGKLVEKNPAFAVIENNGMGYILQISVHTYSQLPEQEPCLLYTHLVVREDAMQLFGFATREERDLFRQLISVSGVGVGTARLILSSLSPAEVVQAIATANISLLQKIKGIGTKTAQRIVVDLKDKLSKDFIPGEKMGKLYNTKKDEALSGLIILGFPKSVAEKALSRVIENNEADMPVEELIKQALKVL